MFASFLRYRICKKKTHFFLAHLYNNYFHLWALPHNNQCAPGNSQTPIQVTESYSAGKMVALNNRLQVILHKPCFRNNPLQLGSRDQFEFWENLEYIYGKCCWRARPCSPATFSIQIFLAFLKFKPS